nr:hypothetical protein [Serratia symbiotica]
MLHNLGIELNEPLRLIHGLAERLRNQPDRKQQTLLNQLAASSSSVLELIENITLLTQLETQDWQPSHQSFAPVAMIDELLLEALPAINQKGLALFNHFHLDVDLRQGFTGDRS